MQRRSLGARRPIPQVVWRIDSLHRLSKPDSYFAAGSGLIAFGGKFQWTKHVVTQHLERKAEQRCCKPPIVAAPPLSVKVYWMDR
jgi:hypothetical protein